MYAWYRLKQWIKEENNKRKRDIDWEETVTLSQIERNRNRLRRTESSDNYAIVARASSPDAR